MGLAVCWVTDAGAAEIRVEGYKEVPGNICRFPVAVGNVSGLAGLDVEIGYDADKWHFVQVRKSGKVGGFLISHNANEPGTLHVVMASPNGVDIMDDPVFFVDFEALETGSVHSLPAITKVEGMNGRLESIGFDFGSGTKEVQ
jgi:hypothetical protein